MIKENIIHLLRFICTAAMTWITATTIQAQTKASFDLEIMNYFTKGLQLNNKPFTSSQKLKNKDLHETQQRVWQLWKQANNNYREEKLPNIIPLLSEAPQKHFLWQIPDSLEPHATMNYFYGSKGERPQEGYPLYLYLHGSGPKLYEWTTSLKWCQQFKDDAALYFIPQIPNEDGWYRWWQKSKIWAWNKLFRQALCSDVVDPHRLFILGVSEGGYGSQRLASFYADYLAGAGPMAGGEPLRNAPAENCSQIGFSLLTGEKDGMFYRNVLTGKSKEMYDSLQAQYPGEFKHNIKHIANSGHGINYNLMFPWLKENVRQAQPHHWIWEDFAMDGVRRKGFYNLQVIENGAKDNDERIRYEMTIHNNQIDLKIERVEYITLKKGNYDIELEFTRRYTPVESGRYRIYLSEQLIDMSKSVTLFVNNKRHSKTKVKAKLENLVNSCAFYGDPLRIFPGSIDILLTKD